METPDGRTLRGERALRATRARILDQSRLILRSNTNLDLTVQRLATELNLSRPTIYHHFPTVHDILQTLSNDLIDELFSNLPDVAVNERSYLEKFVSKMLDLFISDSHLVRNLVLAAVLGNSVSGLFKGDLEALLVDLLRQLDPEIRPVNSDPELAARVMSTYFRGALYGWAAGFIDDETFATEVRRASTLSVSSSRPSIQNTEHTGRQP
jgi:AcrR family transcriptional regulator